MFEVLSWLEVLNDLKRVAALSASNLLLLYFVAYLLNRKAAFIVAFLFTEFYGASVFSNSLTNIQFYLGYALIYCLLYFYLNKRKERLRTLSAVFLVILLDTGSALDACFYPQDETIFYQAYPYFYVFVHLCVIVSLINWRIFQSIVGAIINYFTGVRGVSYCASFLCYYLRKANQ